MPASGSKKGSGCNLFAAIILVGVGVLTLHCSGGGSTNVRLAGMCAKFARLLPFGRFTLCSRLQPPPIDQRRNLDDPCWDA